MWLRHIYRPKDYLSLYLGATGKHMSEGAALLSQTSIPIGGQNTNAVIAGHRGWRGASYFRYIDKLQPGDKVGIVCLEKFISNLPQEDDNT